MGLSSFRCSYLILILFVSPFVQSFDPPTNRTIIREAFGRSQNLSDVCGVNHNTRIVGGQNADPKSWLWMAALLQKPGRQYCGGALITKRHVITAAHCLVSQNPRNVLVRLGAYDFSDDVDPVAKDYEVTNFKIHANYDKISHRDDIAIITLKEEARFTDVVRPICLPPLRRTFFGQIATVVGWGSKEYGGPSTKTLREVTLPVWNNTDCSAAYSINFNDTVLCAGYRDGSGDTCQGDSGGPLMVQGQNRRWMLIGIVSFGYRCSEPGFPGVYTRTNRYLDWIEKNTRISGEQTKPIVQPPEDSVKSLREKLRAKRVLLNNFERKSINGRQALQRLTERLELLLNEPDSSEAEIKLLDKQIEETVIAPKWFLKNTKLCFKWSSLGDSGTSQQCWASSSQLCAEPNSYTQYYNDQTDGRGSGCSMRWIIQSRSYPTWFKNVEICRQYLNEGNATQCNGGITPKKASNCAKIGNFTDVYVDNTQGSGGGCMLSWKLSVPESSPLWALNLGICLNYLGEDTNQCGSDNRRQICAYANRWTDFYRDNTDLRPGGCQLAWGLFTAEKVPSS